jgi:ribosomal protein S18 acetylase RimI-like enzyme
MSPSSQITIRRAEATDAAAVARLLHDFNTEFGDPTPGVAALTERAGEMIAAEEMIVMLAGEGPEGLAQLRLRPSVWSGALDAYLEEVYVAPAHRGRGIGRALLESVLEVARAQGATRIDLGTSETDTAAIGLYESCGFSNLEHGAKMLFYERDL